MSFYATMDRTSFPVVSLLFSALAIAAGCGDAGTQGIDGPGAHSSNPANGSPRGSQAAAAADAAADQGSPYGDPAAIDAGCQPPNLTCNGVCVAVDNDPSNCGACGNACIGADAVCNAGRCGCTGQLEDYCDGVGCMDVSSDFNNCGACGNACDPNNDQACTGGVCVPNCCN